MKKILRTLHQAKPTSRSSRLLRGRAAQAQAWSQSFVFSEFVHEGRASQQPSVYDSFHSIKYTIIYKLRGAIIMRESEERKKLGLMQNPREPIYWTLLNCALKVK